MNNLSEFFHMGGYAFYVWTAYAITLIVLAANIGLPLIRGRQIRRSLARRGAGTGRTP